MREGAFHVFVASEFKMSPSRSIFLLENKVPLEIKSLSFSF